MRAWLVLLHYRWRARRGGDSPLSGSIGQLGAYALPFFALQNLALASLALYALFGLTAPALRPVLLTLSAYALTFGAMVLTLAAGANAVLGKVYEAPHLPLVMSWPIPPGAIYAAGFFDALGACLGVLAGFIAPVWVALGLAARTGWGFVMIGLAGLLAEVLLGAAVIGLAFCVVLRHVRTARLRSILIGAMLAGLVALVFGLQILSVQVLNNGWRTMAASLANTLSRGGLFPHGLAARAALAASLGRIGSGLGALGCLCGMAIMLTIATLCLGGRTFQICWSNAQETSSAKARASAGARRGGRLPASLAVMAKDWRILLREPLFWVNITIYFLIVSFYAWAVAKNAVIAGATDPAMRASHLFFVALFATGWLAQAGAMAVSREGHAWWIVQAAPVQVLQLLVAKLLLEVTGLVALFLPALMVIRGAGLPLPEPVCSIPLLAGLILALCATGLVADLILPDFTLRLDIKMSGAHGGGKLKVLLAMIAGFAATGLTGATFVLGQALMSAFAAALLVLAEGILLMVTAVAIGGWLMRRVLVMS